MQDAHGAFSPWEPAVLVMLRGIRCVCPVVRRPHVPQRRERLRQLAHVGPARTVEVLGDLFDGEGLLRVGHDGADGLRAGREA